MNLKPDTGFQDFRMTEIVCFRDPGVDAFQVIEDFRDVEEDFLQYAFFALFNNYAHAKYGSQRKVKCHISSEAREEI
jgi:hypothetical protein